MADTPEKTPRKRAALQVLEKTATNCWSETSLGEFDSRADALRAISENGKAGVQYIIAESRPIHIEERTHVRRKLV